MHAALVRPVPSAATRSVLDRAGAPLPPELRRPMERGFGTSFADVRLHVNAVAAHEVGARAFTSGRSVVLDAPARDDHHGRELIAHELAHVVQQRAGTVPDGTIDGGPSDPLERQADAMARAAIADGSTGAGKVASGRGEAAAGGVAASPTAAPIQRWSWPWESDDAPPPATACADPRDVQMPIEKERGGGYHYLQWCDGRIRIVGGPSGVNSEFPAGSKAALAVSAEITRVIGPNSCCSEASSASGWGWPSGWSPTDLLPSRDSWPSIDWSPTDWLPSAPSWGWPFWGDDALPADGPDSRVVADMPGGYTYQQWRDGTVRVLVGPDGPGDHSFLAARSRTGRVINEEIAKTRPDLPVWPVRVVREAPEVPVEAQTQPHASPYHGTYEEGDSFFDPRWGGRLPASDGDRVLVPVDRGSLVFEAAESWQKMQSQMIADVGFAIAGMGSNYRNYEEQEDLRTKNCGGDLFSRKASCTPNTAALSKDSETGDTYSTSNHGLGRGVDVKDAKGDTLYFKQSTATGRANARRDGAEFVKSGGDFTNLDHGKIRRHIQENYGGVSKTPSTITQALGFLWMDASAFRFGWYVIDSEAWHWEYWFGDHLSHERTLPFQDGQVISLDPATGQPLLAR
jgi:hypothetical protein